MLKAPPLQNATDTIATLSSRLVSATLLEDKRASILGLRSFAKQYPASVASGSLRDLISCLRDHGARLGKDGEGDLDTVRSVLETLLMLFNPDANSPEASDDIALWLADEFSQRQDNITILLDLLEGPDYYARIYALQLLTSIASARPERTQQCILSAPLGTARLVGVLDDGRDAVRDAALLLLVDLTSVSQTDLQKLIAFEDAFPRIFKLIDAEGGIAEGGVLIQDCLSLLANLVRHSSSNQSLFRETGCLPKLSEAIRQAGDWSQEENEFSRSNRERNAWGTLAVIHLFLESGELGTKSNQDAFWKAGIVQLVLDLAFDAKAPPPVRSKALQTCAAMITSNHPIQESFASLGVLVIQSNVPIHTNGNRKSAEPPRTYVIEALLGLLLGDAAPEQLELRSSAATLIKAYCLGHQRTRQHFLQRAIAGFVEGEADSSNVLSAVMSGPHNANEKDPLQLVFASDILSQLIIEDEDAKDFLRAVSEGNAEKGEDVISAVQSLASHLMASLQAGVDSRIAIAYLALLTTALFNSQLLINDCLAEGSSLLGLLIDTAGRCKDSQVLADDHKSLLPGLSAFLLGTIYEFSSKDSPIPRRTLQPLLLDKLGRQRYFEALKVLRQNPFVRDAELSSGVGAVTSNGINLFDMRFVELLKEEHGRLLRAIDKDPGIEVVAAKDRGVDRDILDDLRGQLDSKDEALKQLEQGSLLLRQNADQQSADHRRELQSLQSSQRSMEVEVENLRRVNESLQKEHGMEISRLKEDMGIEVERAQKTLKSQIGALKQQHERELERLKGQHGASMASERTLSEDKLRKAAEQATRDAKGQVDEVQAILTKEIADLKDAVQKRDNELVVSRQDLKNARLEVDKGKADLENQTKARLSSGEELKRVKELQTNLEQLNSKAMARVKTLQEDNKNIEDRSAQLLEERDQLSKARDEFQGKIKEAEEEIAGLKLELSVERKGFSELEIELEKVKSQLSETRDELQSSKKEREEAKDEEELEKTKEALSEALKDSKTLKKELEKSKQDVEQAKAETEKIKSELDKANKSPKSGGKGNNNKKPQDDKRVKQLETQLAEKTKEADTQAEEAKKARGELDDMLMVMSDIEAKRDEYRDRLKKAGQTVSEDEEEDEDEGDEDGDGEEREDELD